MDLSYLEQRVSHMDQLLRPIAQERVDINDPDWMTRARERDPLAEVGITTEARSVLDQLIVGYAEGGEGQRAAIRGLFDLYTSFRWAVNLIGPADTPERFRQQLLHLSARDQGSDTRDELLNLRDMCQEATAAGVAIEPILTEVAQLSSDVDRYGWGSMRGILLRHVASA
jgi:hypothetical protein